LIALIALSYAFSAAAAPIRVDGGAAPINNIFRRVQEPFTKKTGIELVISEDGPDVALHGVDQGKVDLASAGLGQEDWLKLMDEKKISLSNRASLKFRVIGKDLVKVISNTDAKVSKLSVDQLRSLFTGKVTNWKEVGGSDQKVVVVYGDKIPGTHKFFAKKIMGGEGYAKNKVDVGTAPEVVDKVKATPGAIGLAPMGIDLSGVNVPQIVVIGRPVSVATQGVPSKEIQELLSFIAKDGQQYLPK
jgi:phosphate transport system substrate-binding protein